MRLICPNCGAQYEVDDGVVPEGGRDVQCSNCGHTWFQRPAHKDPELTDELNEATTDDLPESEPDDDSADATPEVSRPELDVGVANILRQEAEHEAAQRDSEGTHLETQPDLGLSDAPEEPKGAMQRMARLRGLEEDEAIIAAAAAGNGTRKDLLPDIEEINSTLTAASERDDETAGEYRERRHRSGFRRGFSLTLLFFALLALVYAYAPKIVESVPAAEPALSFYVEWVNNLRAAVDGYMQQAVTKLTALVSQISGTAE